MERANVNLIQGEIKKGKEFEFLGQFISLV